jgi:3-phenylpropionate/cinnamic acid dioxygenase small subunit
MTDLTERTTTTSTDPAAALQRAVDEAAIRNVIAKLAQMADADTDDFTEYLTCWTEDATTEHPTDAAHGHEEIRQRSLNLRAQGVQGPGANTLHVITTTWVRSVEGDEAHADSYWHFYGGCDQPLPTMRAMGRYDDLLRRTPDGWKMHHRICTHGR